MRRFDALTNPRWLSLMTAAPIGTAIIAVAGSHWLPSSDWALEVMRISDVGGGRTPLVGAWSRWGFAHPGPWQSWLLAPFHIGLGTTGVLIGTGVINAAAAAGAVALAGRRGRMEAAVVALATLALIASLGISTTIDPWNPYVAILPFWLYFVSLWLLVTGDRWALPVTVLAGSFAVQVHIGVLVLVAGLGAFTVITAGLKQLRHRRELSSLSGGSAASDESQDSHHTKLPFWLAAGLFAVMWIPPILHELVASSGNFSRIVDFLRSSPGPPWGWAFAASVAGHQLGPGVPWITGDDANASGLVAAGPVLPAVLVTIAVAATGVAAWKRGLPSEAALAGLSAAAVVLATVATSQLISLKGPYLILWWHPVAASCAAALLMFLVNLLDEKWKRFTACLLPCAALVAAALVVFTGWPVRPPQQEYSHALHSLTPKIADALSQDTIYAVDTIDARRGTALSPGVVAALRDLGFDARAPTGANAELQYGSHRLATEPVPRILLISQNSLDAGVRPPDNSQMIAAYDSLSAAERAEIQSLSDTVGEDLREKGFADDAGSGQLILTEHLVSQAIDAGFDPQAMNRYRELQERDISYRVFLSST